MKKITIHKLRWPSNWPHAAKPVDSRFSGDITINQAAIALQWEIEHIRNVKVDTIVITAGDGTIREPALHEVASGAHPGYAASVFFTTDIPLVLACDKWRSVAHNLWALAKHVESIRSQERWGVGSGRMAWQGYGQLPPSPNAERETAHRERFTPTSVAHRARLRAQNEPDQRRHSPTTPRTSPQAPSGRRWLARCDGGDQQRSR